MKAQKLKILAKEKEKPSLMYKTLILVQARMMTVWKFKSKKIQSIINSFQYLITEMLKHQTSVNIQKDSKIPMLINL
jgi:uncharacterized protein YvpB